jgi:hypothetical protein
MRLSIHVVACAAFWVVSSSAQEPPQPPTHQTSPDRESGASSSGPSSAGSTLGVRRKIAEAYGFILGKESTWAQEPNGRARAPAPSQAEPARTQAVRQGEEVREFRLDLSSQDNPSSYCVQVANPGQATAAFSMTFNGSLYRSSQDVCAEIVRMPPEYAGEPVYRKAWRFVRDHRYHYAPLTELRWQHTPALFFNSIGFGFCDDSATLLYYLWHRLGYEARVWGLTGHVVSEVSVDGRWEMYDAGLPGLSDSYYTNYLGPQECVYYHNRAGQVAGVEELEADPTLITDPYEPILPLLETSNPFYCYSSYVAGVYASTEDNQVEEWYMVDEPDYTFQLQIPPGGSLLLPSHATNVLRVTYGDPTPPLIATATLVIPSGYSGTLDNQLVVQSIHGSPLDTVNLRGQDFLIGSPELQDFIDQRTDHEGDYFSMMTFPQVTAQAEIVFLLNPLLIEMRHRNVLRLEGNGLGDLTAEVLTVPPTPGP